MANTFFKSFAESDRTSSRTLLHEAIPITGTLVSGTYNAVGGEMGDNVKAFSHEMFKSVYDYPYLSSSANHIFDVSYGFDTTSEYYNASGSQAAKKLNMYTQMAQVLAGFDTNGSVRSFDTDGNYSTDGDKMNSVFFVSFSRLLVKDEIKKGSFSMSIGTGSSYLTPFSEVNVVTDVSASTSYKINSPAGEFGLLNDLSDTTIGHIYYQAGIAVLTASVLGRTYGASTRADGGTVTQLGRAGEADEFVIEQSGSNGANDAFIHRIQNIQFNNTTELNSTIYFCRANHNEFNYSSNPTYLSDSKIVVKANELMMPPRSYATTVGLYSADNELLAVAKLSEPLRKDPTNELTLRVRLDY